MLDLHSHILVGIDDGVSRVEDARALALDAAGQGIRAIAATPHVRSDFPTTAQRMEHGVAALRADFAQNQIPLDVLHGGEIALPYVWNMSDDDLVRFTIAQNGVYLLVEFPYEKWTPALELGLAALRGRGLRPILAHPERNPDVQDRPDRLEPLVSEGTLVQVTAASLDGRGGPSAQLAAQKLLSRQMVHLIASDAHGPGMRNVGFAPAVAAVGDLDLARYLTEDAPAAIVAGEEVEEPPPFRPH